MMYTLTVTVCITVCITVKLASYITVHTYSVGPTPWWTGDLAAVFQKSGWIHWSLLNGESTHTHHLYSQYHDEYHLNAHSFLYPTSRGQMSANLRIANAFESFELYRRSRRYTHTPSLAWKRFSSFSESFLHFLFIYFLVFFFEFSKIILYIAIGRLPWHLEPLKIRTSLNSRHLLNLELYTKYTKSRLLESQVVNSFNF